MWTVESGYIEVEEASEENRSVLSWFACCFDEVGFVRVEAEGRRRGRVWREEEPRARCALPAGTV